MPFEPVSTSGPVPACLRSDLIPFGELPRIIPGRPHLSTVHRWRLRGVAGIRLRTLKIGGRRFVDPRDLAEFCRRLSADSSDGGQPESFKQKNQRRAKASQAAERELDREGL
jgi:hypothetical protein